eukprot:758721-Hanusia_phi.AAC.2
MRSKNEKRSSFRFITNTTREQASEVFSLEEHSVSAPTTPCLGRLISLWVLLFPLFDHHSLEYPSYPPSIQPVSTPSALLICSEGSSIKGTDPVGPAPCPCTAAVAVPDDDPWHHLLDLILSSTVRLGPLPGPGRPGFHSNSEPPLRGTMLTSALVLEIL